MRFLNEGAGSRMTKQGLSLCAAGASLSLARAWAEEVRPSASLGDFIRNNYTVTLGILPALAMLALLVVIVNIDRFIRPELKRVMRLIVLVVFSLVAQNYLEYLVVTGEANWLARTLLAIYGYAIRPVILILFMQLTAPRKRLGWAWALAGVNTLVNATALFSPICFYIDDNNTYWSGPLSETCLFVSVALMICLLVMTIRAFQPKKYRATWVPILVVTMILAAVGLDYNVGGMAQPISYLTIASVIGCTAYFIWLHLQFVREYEQALQAEQRIQIMMSQIQPHFLYNTLSTIQAMCVTEPEEASRVVEKFSRYLRQNMDTLSNSDMIPIEKEIDHTRIYADIEMTMFPHIQVRFDVADTGFVVPALTIQPLVENAIRHGARARAKGLVSVTVRRTPEGHEIVIEDNGKGFDASQAPSGGQHIGISNVRERLERQCGGTLQIESAIGEGTRVTLGVPDRGQPPRRRAAEEDRTRVSYTRDL